MTRWIGEAEVAELLDLDAAIDAVERALAGVGVDDGSTSLPKTHAAAGRAGLHATGGVLMDGATAGVKAWLHTPQGAEPLLVLWDSGTGSVLAVIEAFALGQLRTAAITAIATSRMAAAGADELTLVATGRQAVPQAAAVAAVRALRRIVVVGRDEERRRACVERIKVLELAASVEETDDLRGAVEASRIIVTATRSTSPIIDSSMVSPGSHINAIGAISPGRVELAPDLLARCQLVAADDPLSAMTLSAELEGVTELVPLHRLVVEQWARPSTTDVTLFKAMGLGLADVAVGVAALERATVSGSGILLPDRRLVEPSLRSTWAA